MPDSIFTFLSKKIDNYNDPHDLDGIDRRDSGFVETVLRPLIEINGVIDEDRKERVRRAFNRTAPNQMALLFGLTKMQFQESVRYAVNIIGANVNIQDRLRSGSAKVRGFTPLCIAEGPMIDLLIQLNAKKDIPCAMLNPNSSGIIMTTPREIILSKIEQRTGYSAKTLAAFGPISLNP